MLLFCLESASGTGNELAGDDVEIENTQLTLTNRLYRSALKYS